MLTTLLLSPADDSAPLRNCFCHTKDTTGANVLWAAFVTPRVLTPSCFALFTDALLISETPGTSMLTGSVLATRSTYVSTSGLSGFVFDSKGTC